MILKPTTLITRVWRLFIPKPKQFKINYVTMFDSAEPKCVCDGTGWYRDLKERCMRRCVCVHKDDQALGNE